MSILGVDPGMGVTGFTVLDENPSGDLCFKRCGQVRTHPKSPFSERLKKIFDQLLLVIDEEKPTAVAIEDTFFANNVKSALKLGQARGVAVLAAAFRGLPVFEYTPTKVKMAVVGYGAASKDQVEKMVSQFLNLSKPLGSDHESDAAAVAICHAHSARFHRRVDQSIQTVSGYR